MAIIKCKMCGGTLEINSDESIGVCEYCGTRQTLPKLSDERKANLYDRANHLRRNNEYDKAMNIYEQILNVDKTDAESYWSLVLCRYGIEYVEDPVTHKRVPTINRAQYMSVFADDDYKSAIRYADAYQREIYEAEAREIDRIQSGILEISKKEKPFDIFICYKETDSSGRRTTDSVLATDLYYQLEKEGFKVFFSRITLEDKLGYEYEPYIFAALNSAKVMVVIGTKPEHFNSVWVRNEWQRYMDLIKRGENKTIIPAYRDMDPYDLPEEFGHLQAQDMSKLGFMQDLTRGIKKLVSAEGESVGYVSSGSERSEESPTIRRAYIFLEDGDWKSADEYSEKALDTDAKNADAYLIKLMAALKVHKKEDLLDVENDFTDNPNYLRIIRFADTNLKKEIESYGETIKARCEARNKEEKYVRACSIMESSAKFEDLKKAVGLFGEINDYKDSKKRKEECILLADKARAEAAISAEHNKKIMMIAGGIALILIIALIINSTVIVPSRKYKNAVSVMESGEYEEAIAAFEELGDYKDCAELIENCRTAIKDETHLKAVTLMEQGKYKQAIEIFEQLEGYKYSVDLIKECEYAIADESYQKAVSLLNIGDLDGAEKIFRTIKEHKDSAEQIETIVAERKYQKAVSLMENKKYKDALEIFEGIEDYKDSADKIATCNKKIKKNSGNGGGSSFNDSVSSAGGKGGMRNFSKSLIEKSGSIKKYRVICPDCGAGQTVSVDYDYVSSGSDIPVSCYCGNIGSFKA